MRAKRCIIRLSLFFLVLATSTADALEFEFVLSAKKGHLYLVKETQAIDRYDFDSIDPVSINFSKDASKEKAVSFEMRMVFKEKHVLSVGPEHISYENSFSPAPPDGRPAVATSSMILVTAKYYYYGFSPKFRPFVGVGIGGGETSVPYYNDYDSNTVELGTLGFETLIGRHFGFIVQFMNIWNDSSGKYTYDGSARGLFLGLRLGV